MNSINVLLLKKANGQVFRFAFTDSDKHIKDVLDQIAKFAANPELDFSWNDAAKLSNAVRARACQIKSSKFVSRFSHSKVLEDGNDV